jgi:hypothetical protein
MKNKIKAGAEVVLLMRRGRVLKDKKRYYTKYFCRKTKGGKSVQQSYLNRESR